MRLEPKPLSEQIIVITGASTGIGLAAARLAAERGARVVLVSGDDADVAAAVREIQDRGDAGGAVINLAGKHAVKGFTNSLRLEVEESDIPEDPLEATNGFNGSQPLDSSADTAARLHRGKTLLGLAVIGAGLVAANRGRH